MSARTTIQGILIFYAMMTDREYDDVLNEYLGVSEHDVSVSNKLYMAVNTAAACMSEGQKQKP